MFSIIIWQTFNIFLHLTLFKKTTKLYFNFIISKYINSATQSEKLDCKLRPRYLRTLILPLIATIDFHASTEHTTVCYLICTICTLLWIFESESFWSNHQVIIIWYIRYWQEALDFLPISHIIRQSQLYI